jgi:hypothetical protein
MVGHGVGVVLALQRGFFAVVAAFAVLLAVLHGTAGLTDLVVYAGPLLLIAGLLLSGRFVGEERIVERLERFVAVARSRRVRARWPRVPARTLSSLLAHDPRDERGPPAGVLAA